MKTTIIHTNNLCWIAVGLFLLASCKKYNSAGFTSGSGAPSISSVHTLSKTDTAAVYRTIVTMDSSGKTDTTMLPMSQQPMAFDSITTAGNEGEYYVIYGENLGSATSVAFNGVNAYFNRALMTDKSIIVAIPQKVPTSGPQATDTLTVTTLHGVARYHFVVITPPPTIASATDWDFWSGSQITFSGVGFASVTSVGLTNSNATCTIVSQSDTVMTLQFPSAAVNRCNLIFNYTSGGSPVVANSSQEFIDLDNAYNIVFSSSFQNGWVDASWSGPSGMSNGATHAYGGTQSAQASYPAGGWKIEGWANWWPGFTDTVPYKFLTFWVKGGTANHTLILVGDQMAGGYSQNTSAPAIQQIPVTPGTWTYYKIPLGTGANELNYWANGPTAKQLGFFLQGQPGDVNETMYFDEVSFTK